MKIRAEVIAVETIGEKLSVTFQGSAKRESNKGWARLGKHTIQVPASTHNGRVYHVGRIVNLGLQPAGA